MSDRILVFIPCYNCEPQIGRVLAQLAAVSDSPFDEVLVVDNGSRDGTVRAAVEALERLPRLHATVVRNAENYNLGGSHKVAFRHAFDGGFSHVVVLHGDDQGSIADALPIIRRGDHRMCDASLGARFMRGSQLLGYSRIRRWGNAAFNGLFSLCAGRRVYDLGSGLNVFARSVFAGDEWVRYPDDLRFNVYLLLGMFDRGLRTSFFPISWREEDQISNVRIVSQSVRTLYIAAEYLLSRSHFRHGEHRTVPRVSYSYEVVARSGDVAPHAGEHPSRVE